MSREKLFEHEMVINSKIYYESKEKVLSNPSEASYKYEMIYERRIGDKFFTIRQTISEINDVYENVTAEEYATNLKDEEMECFKNDWDTNFVPAMQRELEEHIEFLETSKFSFGDGLHDPFW